MLIASAVVVAGWGYFLYIGVIDPNGGVNILWPLFGIANQMLAAIALSVATGVLVKQGKLRFAWVTGMPLTWLAIVTTTAAWQKIFAVEPRIGFLAGANDLAQKLAAGAAERKTSGRCAAADLQSAPRRGADGIFCGDSVGDHRRHAARLSARGARAPRDAVVGGPLRAPRLRRI